MLVAAVLVACVRLRFLDVPLNLRHRGPNVFPCDAAFRKGDEMGWFEQGSTAILFAPADFSLCDRGRRDHPHGRAAHADANCLSMILSENRCPLFGIML